MFYIASDSPAAQEEFMNYFSPETRIFSLSRSVRADLRALASQRPYVQSEFDGLPKDERIRLTRGMIIDFALLSGIWGHGGDVSPAATVCGLR
jgi:hypothetical protein